MVLTASHNPGGPDQDWGIKYNVRNGGPAPEEFTNRTFENSKVIREYKQCFGLAQHVDLDSIGTYVFTNVSRPWKKSFTVKVVDSVQSYADMMASQFDFPKLKALISRKDFSMLFDGMHGIAGPYATEILGKRLGVPPESLLNCNVLPDFGGLHPDPNLTYAAELAGRMGLGQKGEKDVPVFGAACDGDADRNMVLGRGFFVTPSDSLAVLLANHEAFLRTPPTGVARSMPTSGAVDQVAKALGLPLYETPTGWKYFGNLMEENRITLCGEESFGTGSTHIREKDGLWAILAWLAVLAHKNEGTAELIRGD